MNDFPAAETEDRYRAIDKDLLRPAVLALCARLGLSTASVVAFETGSLPVYAVGDDHVLKLYPPVYAHELTIESTALGAVAGRLPIPTPGVRATGVHRGWGYLLMDRLHGESLLDAWPRVPTAERVRLMSRLGTALARLHAVPPPELDPPHWSTFLTERRGGCVEAQRAHGLAESWLTQIPDFLDGVDLPPSPSVLLHTEFMPVHVLVREHSGGWTPTGLFDFEPAMRGPREYDLVAVGLFITRGDPRLMRAFVTAYGYHPHELPALPRIVMAYALLHVQANLPWFLRETPPPPGTDTLDALAEHWFGIT
ncbi:phosphotransferase [Embleya sp. NBC_00896]|uniref:phosphotransferase n=1 Tax=Embleya sp. NBC_00896 TaxID=2975961 RepID=UPI00386DAFBE|nr:aminoglycoside 3'-phosphotransferase/choline kinase family protein [Embleya sp. NBC_00896]